MKRFVFAAAMIVLLFAGSAISGQTSRNKKIWRMQDAVATAFSLSNLGSLDARRLRRGKIKIVVEHSLLQGAEQFEIRRFTTFKQAERWLKSREYPASDPTLKLPFRETRPLAGCRRGICRYDFFYGILHNRLYLKKIYYGYRRGRVYVKTIYLYDGD